MTEEKLQKLGKYEIIEEIGRGGFAVVYKARDTALNRTVALNVLAPHLLWDPSFIARFRQEAQVVASLKHPNIAIIYDIDEVEGRLYIAMEYVPGRPLSRIIEEQGVLPLEDVIPILQQMASALEYAHAHGLVHRDVRSSNIIVGDDGHVTLTDFGLVKALQSSGLTSEDKVTGTPEYMSPEQAESKPVDGRSDLYSLGIVAYEMLCGSVPFKGDSTPSTLYAQVHMPPPPLRDLAPDLPQRLEEIIGKMLAKAPRDRFQTADELTADLDGLKATLGEPSPPEAEDGDRKRNWMAWTAGAGVIVVLLVWGLVLARRVIPPRPMQPTPSLTGALVAETPLTAGREASTATRVVVPVDGSTPTSKPAATPPANTPTPTATTAPSATPTAARVLATETPIPATSAATTLRATGTPVLEPVTVVIDWVKETRQEIVEGHRPVIVQWRWLVCQPQVVQDHLDALTFEVTIDGHLAASGNMAQHREEVREEDLYDRHWWVLYWSYPMGAFESGSFHRFEIEYEVIRAVSSGCDLDADGHLDMAEAGWHGVTSLAVTVQ